MNYGKLQKLLLVVTLVVTLKIIWRKKINCTNSWRPVETLSFKAYPDQILASVPSLKPMVMSKAPLRGFSGLVTTSTSSEQRPATPESAATPGIKDFSVTIFILGFFGNDLPPKQILSKNVTQDIYIYKRSWTAPLVPI